MPRLYGTEMVQQNRAMASAWLQRSGTQQARAQSRRGMCAGHLTAGAVAARVLSLANTVSRCASLGIFDAAIALPQFQVWLIGALCSVYI